MINTRNLLSRLGTSKKLALQLTSALVISGSLGSVAYAGTKDSVDVEIDGKHQIIRTHANTVGELLKEKNIVVTNKDKVYPSLTTKLKDNIKVKVEKAIPVTVIVNGKKREVSSTAKTVGALLQEQGIAYGEHDEVKPGKAVVLKANTTITIEHAVPVVLYVGGQETRTWSTSVTVADFLKKQNITLNVLDRVEPAKEQMVGENTTIKVTRVEKVSDVAEEAVPFAVIKTNDASLDAGSEKILQEGEEGRVQKTFEVIKENGVEVSRSVVQVTKLKDARDKMVKVGTRDTQEPSRGDDSSTVVSEFEVEATAYSPYCGGCEGTSAGGYNYKANPNMKLIAVDPRLIPLGTKVWVEGYGYAIAGDTGGAIKGKRIDVLMPTESQANAWGRKRVKIRVLR